MVYHFVKHIGIDVEADSLEQAMDFVNDIDNCDDIIEDAVYHCTEDDVNDFASDVASVSTHCGYTEYAGYTDDVEEDDDSWKAEKNFYDYLTDDEEEVRYVITDKGRDWLAHMNGEYPEYDENNYDEHGSRIKDTSDEVDELALFKKLFFDLKKKAHKNSFARERP